MQADSDLVALVDDLLRTDPRLLAAAALVGKVAVVVTEPKPERVRKSTAKKPPPRPGQEPQPVIGPEPEQPKPAAAPWLKVAKAGKVGDAIRAAIGGQWLAVVTVDGGLWGKLRSEDQRRALVLALRGLRHEEREDGSDKVAREAPPLQCWPDTADDLSHLVAALGVDGAEGAAAVSATESLGAEEEVDEVTTEERLDASRARVRLLSKLLDDTREVLVDMRRLWANQTGGDIENWSEDFPGLAASVRDVLGEEPGCEEIGEEPGCEEIGE